MQKHGLLSWELLGRNMQDQFPCLQDFVDTVFPPVHNLWQVTHSIPTSKRTKNVFHEQPRTKIVTMVAKQWQPLGPFPAPGHSGCLLILRCINKYFTVQKLGSTRPDYWRYLTSRALLLMQAVQEEEEIKSNYAKHQISGSECWQIFQHEFVLQQRVSYWSRLVLNCSNLYIYNSLAKSSIIHLIAFRKVSYVPNPHVIQSKICSSWFT